MAKKYFKVRTNYSKTDTSSESGISNVSETRLFEAIDYVDAQKQAIELISKEGLCGECDLEISKVSYDMIIYKGPEGSFQLKFVKETHQELNNSEDIHKGTYWYEIRTIRTIEDEKGNKRITTKYLVEGQNLEEAIEVIKIYLKEDENDWWFSSVQETPIQEVLLVI